MKNNKLIAIIEFAVENEVEAYEFYRDAAEKVKDEFLKQTFEELAKEELEHKEFLKDFLKSDIETMKFEEVEDYKISETIDKPKLSVEMEFSEAIGLAIKNEEEAMLMYENLAEVSLNDDHKEMFLGLMKMEQMHKTRLEEIYVNVAYAEVW